MGYSDDQWRTATLTAKCTGAMSIVGSSSIIYDIVCRKSKMGKQLTMLQILMGMSLSDIVASFTFLVGTWAIPSDNDDDAYKAMGNEATCRVQGFLIQMFGSAVPLYNLCLAVYSYLAINKHWTEDDFSKRRWRFHILPGTFGGLTGLYGLIDDQYHPAGLWCWFAGTDRSDILRFSLFYIPHWITFGCIATLFFVIYRHVHKIEQIMMEQQQQQQQQHDKQQQQQQVPEQAICEENTKQNSFPVADSSTSNLDTETRREKKNSALLTRTVFRQGIQFSCVFILTFLFATITRAQQWIKETANFPVLFLMTFFLPLQGFLNSLVYFKVEIAEFLGYYCCSCWQRQPIMDSTLDKSSRRSVQNHNEQTGIFVDRSKVNCNNKDGINPQEACNDDYKSTSPDTSTTSEALARAAARSVSKDDSPQDEEEVVVVVVDNNDDNNDATESSMDGIFVDDAAPPTVFITTASPVQ